MSRAMIGIGMMGLALFLFAFSPRVEACAESYRITASTGDATYVFKPCDGDDDASDLQRALDYGDVEISGLYYAQTPVDVPAHRRIFGGTISGDGECLRLTGVSGVRVSNVEINGCGAIGLTIRDSHDVTATGSSFVGNTEAVTIINGWALLFTGNIFRENQWDAVDCEPCWDSVISGNVFQDNGTHVLIKLPPSQRNIVMGNTMKGGGGITAGGGLNAIEIASGASLNRIIGNTITDAGNVAILVDSNSYSAGFEDVSHGNSIENNTVVNPAAQGIVNGGGYQTSISYNKVIGSGGPAYQFYHGSHFLRAFGNEAIATYFNPSPAYQIGLPDGDTPANRNIGIWLSNNEANSLDIRNSHWDVGMLIADPETQRTEVSAFAARNVITPIVDYGYMTEIRP